MYFLGPLLDIVAPKSAFADDDTKSGAQGSLGAPEEKPSQAADCAARSILAFNAHIAAVHVALSEKRLSDALSLYS